MRDVLESKESACCLNSLTKFEGHQHKHGHLEDVHEIIFQQQYPTRIHHPYYNQPRKREREIGLRVSIFHQ